MTEKKAGARGRPATKAEGPLGVDGDWFRQRTKELGLTQREVAAFLRRDPALLSRSLSGERTFDARDVAGLAQILKVTSDEILGHMGMPISKPGIPIVGRVLPDGRVSSISTRKGDTLKESVAPPGAEAVIVEAEKGPLASYNGAAFIYVPSLAEPVPPDCIGRLCVVEADEQVVPLIGRLGRANERGKVRISVFETGEELVAKVHRAAAIIAIQLA